jgi:hypothetical protein
VPEESLTMTVTAPMEASHVPGFPTQDRPRAQGTLLVSAIEKLLSPKQPELEGQAKRRNGRAARR